MAAQPQYDFSVLQQGQPTGFAGLLSSPIAQGLLSAGLGALASRGTTSQAIGRGGLLGLSAFGNAAGEQQNRLMQMAQAKMRENALSNINNGDVTTSALATAGIPAANWNDMLTFGPRRSAIQSLFGSAQPSASGATAGSQTDPSGLIPQANLAAAKLDLAFNGGKGLGDLAKPNLINAAPGGTIYDANTRSPIFNSPQDGRQITFGPGGQATAAAVPGWDAITQGQAQAQAQGSSFGNVVGTQAGKQVTGEAPIERTKQIADLTKQYQTTVIPGESTVASVNRALGYLDRLDDSIGKGYLNNVTGPFLSHAPALTQNAANALADLDSIKSKVVLNTMNEMRQASAAGATGFGNMQQNELKVIEDSLGSIQRSQSPEQIRQNLAVIRDAFRGIANSAQNQIDQAKQGYANIPGLVSPTPMRGTGTEATATKPGTLSGPNAQLPRIADDAQYNNLPSGSVFLAPDGKMRRKP